MRKIRTVHIIFCLALILYGATSSLYPFAGKSIGLIISHSGISPFPLHDHPLWSLLAGIVRLLPVPLGAALNILSVVCGAFAMALAYKVFSNLSLDSDYDEKTRILALMTSRRRGWMKYSSSPVELPGYMYILGRKLDKKDKH